MDKRMIDVSKGMIIDDRSDAATKDVHINLLTRQMFGID